MIETSSPSLAPSASGPAASARGWRGLDDRLLGLMLAIIVLIIYCLTAQAHINGSRSPYATDVGEIQNALPRWGTLHFTGYPQYSLLGSAFVTILRAFGIAPALGASLFSALWGALLAALLYWLARELGAWRIGAAGAAVVSSLSLSTWVDASIAEVHTMTQALSLASIWLAMRYRRTGARRDLLWLAAAFAHGVVHQRAVLFLAPALLLIVWPQLAPVCKNLGRIVVIGLGAIATYLYLPLRAWMGASWVFSSPGTWQGLQALLFDTKSERIVRWPADLAELFSRLQNVLSLLRQDLPWPLLALGLIGLGALAWRGRWAQALSLALVIVVHLAVSVIIWEGRISDALLAVKLPAIWACATGLAFLGSGHNDRLRSLAVALAFAAAAIYLGIVNGPQVLAITRDRSSEAVVQRVSELEQNDAITVWMPWGHDYWALAYAQRYRGELQGLEIVDHNASVASIVASGRILVTPEESFYVFSPEWWRSSLSGLALSSLDHRLVRVSAMPCLIEAPPPDVKMLNDEIGVAQHNIWWNASRDSLVVEIDWYARGVPQHDYAVAVHLMAREQDGAAELLNQADSRHPVYGWYPTGNWSTGEIISDHYTLRVPADSQPGEVRVFMYLHDEQGFHNTQVVTLEIPRR